MLTRLLLEKMAETARATGVEGRIVNVSSTIHSWFAGDDAIGYLDRVTRRKMCVLYLAAVIDDPSRLRFVTDC